MPVAPPPPPPPGPPMPSGGTKAADPKGRDNLLASIRAGKTLKKTVTVDKSAPIISGKTSNGNADKIGFPKRDFDPKSATISRTNGLGGLFSEGMPKLKPTGLNYSQQTQSSSLNSLPTANSSSLHNNNFKAELVRKLDTKNRGPPPQPPSSAQKPSLSNSASDTTLTTNAPGSHIRSQSTVSLQNGRHGRGSKPTLAPKPQAPAPPPPNQQSRRPSVSRAQSMRAPASPPILAQPQVAPVYPYNVELGRAPMFHASTDSLIRGGVPRPRPPLKPPSQRPPPPPRSALPPPPAPLQPPPPPPHRVAPPLPVCVVPPLPPARNSSMKNGSNELEVRFASKFHKVHNFPPPPAFMGVTKIYNSKNAKAPAPAPPVSQVNLYPGQGTRLWGKDSSNC